MVDASPFSKAPYRRRTWLRQYLPFWALGLSPKGTDCAAAGGAHQWYNQDGKRSACYHCRVVVEGRKW
jgi:hypothetical protein